MNKNEFLKLNINIITLCIIHNLVLKTIHNFSDLHLCKNIDFVDYNNANLKYIGLLIFFIPIYKKYRYVTILSVQWRKGNKTVLNFKHHCIKNIKIVDS